MSSVAHAEAHQNDGDQTQHTEPAPERFHEGNETAHSLLDTKDERSIANKLAAAEKAEKEEEEAEKHKLRPTEIAKSHGNEPSRGAKIDQQIEDEERAELERKGKA